MLNCDGNENSKEKKTTTTTTFVISELRFPPHRARGGGGGGEYSTKCYTGRLRPDRPIYYYLFSNSLIIH